MSGRAAHLQQTIKQGEELVANDHFGTDKIKERIKDIQVRRKKRDIKLLSKGNVHSIHQTSCKIVELELAENVRNDPETHQSVQISLTIVLAPNIFQDCSVNLEF